MRRSYHTFARKMRRLILLLIALTACPMKSDVPDAAAQITPTKDWLEGRLPASALEGTPVKGGTLTLRVHVEPNGLNRLHDAMAEGTMSRYTIGTVYETLA